MDIRLARIYEESKALEYRVLCDRLWPRGVSKEDAQIQLWAKDITPSDALRKDYHHEQLSQEDFTFRYLEEMDQNPHWEAFEEALKGKKSIVLLTASKNLERSHLPLIKERLLRSK